MSSVAERIKVGQVVVVSVGNHQGKEVKVVGLPKTPDVQTYRVNFVGTNQFASIDEKDLLGKELSLPEAVTA